MDKEEYGTSFPLSRLKLKELAMACGISTVGEDALDSVRIAMDTFLSSILSKIQSGSRVTLENAQVAIEDALGRPAMSLGPGEVCPELETCLRRISTVALQEKYHALVERRKPTTAERETFYSTLHIHKTPFKKFVKSKLATCVPDSNATLAHDAELLLTNESENYLFRLLGACRATLQLTETKTLGAHIVRFVASGAGCVMPLPPCAHVPETNDAENSKSPKAKSVTKSKAPKPEASKSEAPKSEAPKSKASKSEASKSKAPKSEASKSKGPGSKPSTKENVKTQENCKPAQKVNNRKSKVSVN